MVSSLHGQAELLVIETPFCTQGFFFFSFFSLVLGEMNLTCDLCLDNLAQMEGLEGLEGLVNSQVSFSTKAT